MNEYEKYQLQWMLDHNHSIREMITRLGEIAFNEMSNDVGLSFDKIMDEAFEIFEYEQGFKNEEIWLCKDEWEHDLYSSNEYSLTDAGKTKVKHFIEECRIKQDSILKAGLDTAKETTLPSVEDILCNVEDMVDEDGKYTNAWNITDNYLSDPLEMHKDDDFVIHSKEQVKDVLIPLPPSHEVSTSQPHYTEVNLFDVSDDVFHEEDTNDFSPWSDRSINNILRIGSGFVNGKYRIYHLYTAMNVNAKDKAMYLKNEYGIGGQTYDFKNKKQDKGYIDHDSKGLTVCVSSKNSASLFKDSESKTFSWADVSSRIERLIATGKYFTDEEMEHYNSMNKDEILIDRDNDYVLLRDPDENVNQVWTANGEFLSTVQLENETVDEAMEEYYYNISKGDIEL